MITLIPGKDYTKLVERLNGVLLNKTLVVSEFDEMYAYEGIKTGFRSLRPEGCIIGRWWSNCDELSIPYGLDLFVPIALVEDEVRHYSYIDIHGDIVQIGIPRQRYYESNKVTYEHFTIAALDRKENQ